MSKLDPILRAYSTLPIETQKAIVKSLEFVMEEDDREDLKSALAELKQS